MGIGDHRQARNRPYRSQRFPSKTQGMNIEQVLGVIQLAGGMPANRQHQLVRGDAASIIRHSNQAPACLLHLNVNLTRAGINRVFQQLFNHRCWSIHHLAGSDLGCDCFGQDFYWHESSV